jgi:hypothetical protein
MSSRFSGIKRTGAMAVAFCVSCILIPSCQTSKQQVVEPQGSGLGRAEAEPSPPVHDVEHPTNKAQAFPGERMQQIPDSTPTPTPNRAIDRPLDPMGKPLTSPTPDG